MNGITALDLVLGGIETPFGHMPIHVHVCVDVSVVLRLFPFTLTKTKDRRS